MQNDQRTKAMSGLVTNVIFHFALDILHSVFDGFSAPLRLKRETVFTD
jgi:hypothetical protein